MLSTFLGPHAFVLKGEWQREPSEEEDSGSVMRVKMRIEFERYC